MTGKPPLRVAIAGLGAIGGRVARALDQGIPGLVLTAVSAANREGAQALIGSFVSPPRIVDLDALAEADIVVEATPASAFAQVASPAIAAGRILVACSAGALLSYPQLIDQAKATGARIIVPTGAIAGLDAVRAVAEHGASLITIETRKPPAALAGAPYLVANNIDPLATAAPLLVFEGNALEAAKAFPANANVAAALALAGIGPERTRVRIWSDPTITRNSHTIQVESDIARMSLTVETVADPTNPRTSQLSALSVIACLRGIPATLRIGS